MLQVALFEPEIPANTGNIIRLSANTGCQLHLIHPLGFTLDDKKVRRAGLDYHDMACVNEHDSYEKFIQTVAAPRIIACSTKGKQTHSDFQYQSNDILLFGPETRGLPHDILDEIGMGHTVHIPMLATSRSLNLSNAVAVIVYEAWRQLAYLQ